MKRWWAMTTAALLCAAAVPLAAPARAQATASVAIAADRPGATYDRRIFTQFAEHLGNGIYGGLWVGPGSSIPNTRGFRNDVVGALRRLGVPVIRWPGGCFADEYHWREGIGPRAGRPTKVNTNWGGVTEPNSFGTHEFMDFAELIGADAYVSGNVGSAPPAEMAEWVEYMTAPAGTLAELRARNGRRAPWKLPYFGIGNELWGCGGQMRVEYAADLTRRYGQFIKVPAGTRTLKIASGSNSGDYNWTEVMMREAGKHIDGIGVHYYTVPGSWAKKGSATDFDEADYARTLAKTLQMDEIVTRHAAIMDKYDPARRVALAVDEWGAWYDVEPGTNPGFLQQQNTMRDALVAALNIAIFMRHADRVRMANIAQMVNVLQAMILTRGPQMVLTPTYHLFEMYRPFQDATFLPVDVTSPWYGKDQWTMPAVSVVAARGTDGLVHVALANVDPVRAMPVTVALGGAAATGASGRILTAPTIQAHNDFAAPDAVKPARFDGARIDGGTLTATLPPHSVVVLDLQ